MSYGISIFLLILRNFALIYFILFIPCIKFFFYFIFYQTLHNSIGFVIKFVAIQKKRP